MKHSIILLVLVAGLAVTACGTSAEDKASPAEAKASPAEDKASTQVCDARADIKAQVDELRGLTISTATVDGVTANLQAIRADLEKIRDAQGRLNKDRKKQIQSANQAFKEQVTSLVQTVGQSLALADAESQLKTALGQLADSYTRTLGQIDCG